MPERLDWLTRLPMPIQAATSYDPTDPGNVALHARLQAGAGQTLTTRHDQPLPVLHWWGGTMQRVHPTRRCRVPSPVACLLLGTGAVRRVWEWPSINNWLDFILDLDPARLKESPLIVVALASREPKLTDPVWRFRLGD